MVCELPDPPNNDESLTAHNGVIIVTDTDSDEEYNEYSGYEPLPVGPEDADQILTDEEADSDQENVDEGASSLPPITRVENVLVQEVWSNAAPSPVDIHMDSKKVNEVKQAMAAFTLPATSIPEWASAIPEEEWKEQLLKRLDNMKKSGV